MADSQKMGMGVSSGGRRIDDHSFWAGRKGKASVFPDGPHQEKDAPGIEGAGSLTQYEDTNERITKTQGEGVKQIKGRPMKQPGYRH